MNVAIIATNCDRYASGKSTGLWLSELVHFVDVLLDAGHDVTVASPKGGTIPVDPVSLNWLNLDNQSRAFLLSSDAREVLTNSAAIAELDAKQFQGVYLTGGHGVMYDFPEDADLQAFVRDVYEQGGIVSAVCHGTCGLLNVTLSDGQPLIKGRRLTGFSWFEEGLAARKNLVPFNLEAEAVKRGAHYRKGLFPLLPHFEADDRLITGQNPKSAKGVAIRVLQQLG